jgi:hypothetical protein
MRALAVTSYLYEQVNLTHPKTRLSRWYRKILYYPYRVVKCFDPVVKVKVRDTYLYMNASHNFPIYTANHL